MSDVDYLKAARFEGPGRIPCKFGVNAACWHHYPGEALRELFASDPELFGVTEIPPADHKPAPRPFARADQRFTDHWGCVWEAVDDGITGVVVEHPLADWNNWERWTPPDPWQSDGRLPSDLRQIVEQTRKLHEAGRLTSTGLDHGHTWLRLCDIRGYENVIGDMADGEPRLVELIDTIERFNAVRIEQFVSSGADTIRYPEDLGMQVGPMLSPTHFRQYLKPVYERLMRPAREAGRLIHMHSDGDIRLLVDDLIECGVKILNCQDLVNGIDWLRDHVRGRVCIHLDIDRQQITRFGTPSQIDELIHEEVEKLGSRQGGLMMLYGMYPGVPLENAYALAAAMRRYQDYYLS